MDEFYIRPAVEGARLPDPQTGDILKMEGEWKPRSTDWIRAELRGDVVQVDPPAPIGGATVDPSDTPETSTAIVVPGEEPASELPKPPTTAGEAEPVETPSFDESAAAKPAETATSPAA